MASLTPSSLEGKEMHLTARVGRLAGSVNVNRVWELYRAAQDLELQRNQEGLTRYQVRATIVESRHTGCSAAVVRV